MNGQDERERLRSYLAGQSAKLSAADVRRRVDEAATDFFTAVALASDATARTAPAAGEWSVAEIVDHVAVTLDDVTGIVRALSSGRRPAGPMTSHDPASAALPYAELVARLRRSHAAVLDLLGTLDGEPHLDLRIPDGDFGELNWKGFALILRLHYKDHAQQVRNALEAVAGRV
jgi:DinB superfamily